MSFQRVQCSVLHYCSSIHLQCIFDNHALGKKNCKKIYIFLPQLPMHIQCNCLQHYLGSDMAWTNKVQRSMLLKTHTSQGRSFYVQGMLECMHASKIAPAHSLEIHLLSARGGGQPRSSHKLVTENISSPQCSNSPRSSRSCSGYRGGTGLHKFKCRLIKLNSV